MTYDDIANIALALPGVSEKLGRYEIDLMRDGRHMARLREKGSALAIRLPWDVCDRLLAERAEVFYVTPHYRGWPYVLAKLKDLDEELAANLVQASYDAALEKIPVRDLPH